MTSPSPQSDAAFAVTHTRLKQVGQEHVLTFWKDLGEAQRAALLGQIESLDLGSLPGLVRRYVTHTPPAMLPSRIDPAPSYGAGGGVGGGLGSRSTRNWDVANYRRIGEDLLRAGKVAAFTVAGGQGSRLGYEGPKGCFPGGAVTGKPLFQMFGEGLVAAQRRYGRPVPWYIMTSPLNHEATVAFFQEHAWFGLDEANVSFFPQGVMPSFDMASGRILLSAKDQLATNPDGHGGAIRALKGSGSLADMRRRGVEHVSYFQVDNPLVRVVDPTFLGLHAAARDSSGEMSSKMIPKAYPDEKLGVFCSVDGRTQIIEYSDLPRALAEEKGPEGSLRFIGGSIAVHAISLDFLERLGTDPSFELPFHRAEKKVPHVQTPSGITAQPQANNGVKLEKFIFDALPLCGRSLVYETDRAEEFAPIKNATGVDSVESSREIQTERAARWLEGAGVRVPRRADGKADCVLEISPLTALFPEDLKGREIPREVGAGASVAL
ncbi:MAG: UDPGP type 1 family protein [Phycisphaerales bacterium]|nr:UDPGP type 1 family protein [Phycisphaerales bacterium]